MALNNEKYQFPHKICQKKSKNRFATKKDNKRCNQHNEPITMDVK